VALVKKGELAASCSPRSLRVIKKQMWDVPLQSLHEALITDAEQMMLANVCEDFKEAKSAFKDKRPPRFTGN
jgi:enoyl-CoA hydratase/carnithine racemase